MLVRFCLYGFLKNLRLFEAFLLLALLERGLDFLAIGALISVREVVVNLLEIPSGALADGLGRRRSMVVSMAAYVVSYLVLGWAQSWWWLALAMGLYGVGDAFRSGTHKAMIYTWLRQQGRQDERTRVYGYTRSWSKKGSALSALLGGAVLVLGGSYQWVFWASAVPATLNLLNLATYPSSLDEQRQGFTAQGIRDTWVHLKQGLAVTLRHPPMRRLVLGSVAVEGGYAVVKDYIQPVLRSLALGLPLLLAWEEQRRSSAVVALVSAGLFLLASAASKRAHVVEARAGGAEAGVRAVAAGMALSFLLLLAGLWWQLPWLAALAFMALGVAQNLWRPMHVGRFDLHAPEEQGATVLSVESQAKALAAALWAPLLGAMVDALSARWGDQGLRHLLPVALLGLPVLWVALWGGVPRRAA